MIDIDINVLKKNPQKNIRKFLEMINIFSTLAVMLVSWMCAYFQTNKALKKICSNKV